jgi:hypothetical protein
MYGATLKKSGLFDERMDLESKGIEYRSRNSPQHMHSTDIFIKVKKLFTGMLRNELNLCLMSD